MQPLFFDQTILACKTIGRHPRAPDTPQNVPIKTLVQGCERGPMLEMGNARKITQFGPPNIHGVVFKRKSEPVDDDAAPGVAPECGVGRRHGK